MESLPLMMNMATRNPAKLTVQAVGIAQGSQRRLVTVLETADEELKQVQDILTRKGPQNKPQVHLKNLNEFSQDGGHRT